jgi:hypothetical protein
MQRVVDDPASLTSGPRTSRASSPERSGAPIESFASAMGQALGREVRTGPVVGWAKVPDVVGFAQRTTPSWGSCGRCGGPPAVD